jgi:hypothetical protein
MRTLTLVAVSALGLAPVLQAQSTSTVLYRAIASPSHENPPISGSDSSGEAWIEIRLDRDTAGNLTQAIVDFRVDYHFGSTENVRAFHIHRAPAGVNGPVVIDPRFSPPFDATGSGKIFRSVAITDPTGLDTVRALIAKPSDFYFNLHTASAPGGLIRGQLAPADPVSVAVAALGAKVDALAAQLGKLAEIQTQLDLVRSMVRDTGRVLGIPFP